jgi:hypothetical protein
MREKNLHLFLFFGQFMVFFDVSKGEDSVDLKMGIP